MRVVDWNIEWMNKWFAGGNQVAFRNAYKERNRVVIADVANLCGRVAAVIRNLDPDVLTVQEGPSDPREMELFVDTYLKDANDDAIFDVFGGFDGRSQKMYTLVKKTGELRQPTVAADKLTKDLRKSWKSDTDGDFCLEQYRFTRTPVVIEGIWNSHNTKIKILTLHTKSKYVHNQERLWKNPVTRLEFVIEAVRNRRRISSEAMRTRIYLDELIKTDPDAPVVVTGDFNDGPGSDYFEKHYLTHSVTDILLGSTYYPELLFKHAFIDKVPKDKRYTAIFDDFVNNIQDKPLLLDHILISPSLSNRIQDAGIGHCVFNSAIDHNAVTDRQKYPSDHRPVFVDLA